MAFFDSLSQLCDVWKELERSSVPVYIYGTGNGCEGLFSLFKAKNITPSGIIVSDDHSKKKEFLGLKTITVSELESTVDKCTIALAFGTDIPQVMQRIDRLDDRYDLFVPEMSVADDTCFEKDVFLSDIENAKKAYSLLSDDRSRQVFEALCRFKITGRLSHLRPVFTTPGQSYKDILHLSGDEIYMDMGAYNGDTVKEFLSYTGGSYEHIYCFEPDMRNFRKCVKNLSHLDSIDLVNAAAWSFDTTLAFSSSSGRQSAVSSSGRLTSARSADSFLAGREVTYIKYDVEGADTPALLGSRRTINKYYPKICTAAYHRPYDFYKLILLINDIAPGYNFYLRQYPYYPCWETNIFAVR